MVVLWFFVCFIEEEQKKNEEKKEKRNERAIEEGVNDCVAPLVVSSVPEVFSLIMRRVVAICVGVGAG